LVKNVLSNTLKANKEVLNPFFLIYYLKKKNIRNKIRNLSGQAVNQVSIKPSELHRFKIFLPPLPEQRKISEILETIDNAIEKTDRIIEKYKRIKQGLMQDLLTRGIDENGQIRSEETHRFKDSELGRIPEEWEVVEFYDLFDVIDNRGRTPPFSEEGIIPYLSAENVKEGKILYYFENFVTEEIYKRYMRGYPTQDYILFTTEAPLGEVALAPKIKFCFAQRVIAIKPKKGYSKYYLFLIQHELIQRQLNNLVSGTTVKGISAKNLRKINFIVPPLPEQHRIASVFSQIDEAIEKEQKYKEKLQRIKHGLMEDLLTGTVRVNHLIGEGVKDEKF
jgi:type I restriction enzyme S subunit